MRHGVESIPNHTFTITLTETEKERVKVRERERVMVRERTNVSETEREGGGRRHTGKNERQKEKRERDNTLLHMDKDLSTCRLFCKSVPDDKHSNTQYIKQDSIKYAREKNDFKAKLISV